jgi:hypothetical protein
MQNQMMPKINLLQMPDPAARTAKYVNMMNATKQQEAAERQARIAQEKLDLDKKEDVRKEALQGPAITKAQQDNIVQALGLFREAVSDIAEGDIAAAEAVRADLIARVPGYDKFVLPATEWTPAYKNQLKLTAEKEIDKTIATPVASLELGMDNSPRSVTVGGLNPQQSPVFDAPETGAPRTPTRPAPAQVNPMARNAPAPNAAGEAPGSLGLVVASALQTRVMSQADLDKMLANVQPASRPKIMNWVRENGISVADAPPLVDNQMRDTPMSYDGRTPQSQFAVMRGQPMQSQTAGLAGAPEMQQTMAQTQPRTATRLQQRNPNMSPYPGSAQVPLSRVAAEAAVQRETPKEAADKAAATARATAAVDTEKKAAEKLPGRKQVSTLINKVRAAYEQLDKAEAIPSETRGGFANAMDYFGTSSLGREAQKMVGTKSSKYLSEIINSRKLLATAIKNATGMSAQEMNSNVELQLTLDALTDPTQGIEAARTTLNTLEELYGAPAAAPRAAAKTPVIPTLTPAQVRANPNIKRWKRSDNGQIMVRK